MFYLTILFYSLLMGFVSLVDTPRLGLYGATIISGVMFVAMCGLYWFGSMRHKRQQERQRREWIAWNEYTNKNYGSR